MRDGRPWGPIGPLLLAITLISDRNPAPEDRPAKKRWRLEDILAILSYKRYTTVV